MLNDLYFKTTCNIRPHFFGPMGSLKIEGPLYFVEAMGFLSFFLSDIVYLFLPFISLLVSLFLYVSLCLCFLLYLSFLFLHSSNFLFSFSFLPSMPLSSLPFGPSFPPFPSCSSWEELPIICCCVIYGRTCSIHS